MVPRKGGPKVIVFPRIAAIRRVEHARLQELVPLIELMPGGFNQARLMHLAVKVGLFQENELHQNQARVRRVVQHFLEIGYLKRDDTSDTWYFPDIQVIEMDRREAEAQAEKQRQQHERLAGGWAVAGDALLAAFHGTSEAGEAKAEPARVMKPAAKLGRFSKKPTLD